MVTTEAVLSPAQFEAAMLTMCVALYDRVRAISTSGSLESTARGSVVPAPLKKV